MKPRTHRIAALIAALTAAHLAAAATATLRAPSGPVYVDEPFTVEIVVADFQKADPPNFPDLPDCDVRVGGTSNATSMSIINGRQTSSITRRYSFELTPHQAGTLSIPAVSVTVDGRAMRTNPAQIAVRPSPLGPADDLLLVEVICPRRRLYVGQQVALTLNIWIKPPAVGGQQLSHNNVFSCIDEGRTDIAPFSNVSRVSEQTRDVDGQAQTYYVYQSTTQYVADRPGPLRFDELVVGVEYPTRFRQGAFGRIAVAGVRRISARPDPLDVDVLPLPAANQPPGFTGAVGTYNLAATATPTQVRVGDPIELTLTLRGDGPVDLLSAPDLASVPDLATNFRLSDAAPTTRTAPNQKSFTTVIRAARDNVTEIPAIAFPYFDPDLGQYVTARSDAIPLVVSTADRLNTAEIAGLDPQAGESSVRARDGLLGNIADPQALLAQPAHVGPTAVATSLLAPPLLFVLAWLYRMIWQPRLSDATRRRRDTAGKTARRKLRDLRRADLREQAAAGAAALTGYLADRRNEPPERFASPAAACALLRSHGADDTLIHEAEALLTRCEQISFAPVDAAAADLLPALEACLTKLERVRL